MRVAYITYEYPPDISAGGIATYVYEVARMIQAKGIEVEVFAGSNYRSGVFEEDNILVHRIQIDSPDEFSFRIADVFERRHKQMPFDLYETPEINANAACIQKRLPELPFVTKLHMPCALQLRLFNYYVPFWQKLRYVIGSIKRFRWDLGYWRTYDPNPERDRDYRMANTATAISAPSEAMKLWACRYWRLDPGRITILVNPFNASSQILDEEYDFDSRNYLCFIGKLNVHKGMVALTKALKEILKANPELKVLLIGSDGNSPKKGITMSAYMQNRLFEYKERIIFTGNVAPSEIPKFLRLSKVCIFPSIWEAFGYVALEAMSAGVPVLVSKGSGLEEVVDYGRFGVVFDALNPKEIIKETNRMLLNKELCKSLSDQGRQRVSFYGSKSVLPDKYVSYYRKIISKYS